MNAKRIFDVLFALAVLLTLSPLLVVVAALVFAQDFRSPFYVANRVGRFGRQFRMVKFRSMVVNADRSGVTSTSSTDSRVTPVGSFVRRYKLDELPQFWNVLIGDMSVVGPRPNVPSGVAVYTPQELRLLDARPGITDIASIVFSDEGEILGGKRDADAAYDELIRPWKSRLGLVYVAQQSFLIDLRLIWLTAVSVFSKHSALAGIESILKLWKAPEDLVSVSRRDRPLESSSPP